MHGMPDTYRVTSPAQKPARGQFASTLSPVQLPEKHNRRVSSDIQRHIQRGCHRVAESPDHVPEWEPFALQLPERNAPIEQPDPFGGEDFPAGKLPGRTRESVRPCLYIASREAAGRVAWTTSLRGIEAGCSRLAALLCPHGVACHYLAIARDRVHSVDPEGFSEFQVASHQAICLLRTGELPGSAIYACQRGVA